MRYSSKCHKCKKVFARGSNGLPYTNQGAADQALRMHVARVHDKTILTPTGSMNAKSRAYRGLQLETVGASAKPGNVVASFDDRRHNRSKLTPEQTTGVLDFIRTRRNEFTTKTACFTAALEANGATGRIRNNSVAVARYFGKAAETPAVTNGEKPKRKYTKRQKPVDNEHGYETMHWCPRCGLDLQALATAMTVAHATSR